MEYDDRGEREKKNECAVHKWEKKQAKIWNIMTSQYVCVWLYDNNHTFEEKKIDNRKRRNPAQLFGRIFFWDRVFFINNHWKKSYTILYSCYDRCEKNNKQKKKKFKFKLNSTFLSCVISAENLVVSHIM